MAFDAVAYLVCQIGDNTALISCWLSWSIGILPRAGRTWFVRGDSQRPEAPSPLRLCFLASKANSVILPRVLSCSNLLRPIFLLWSFGLIPDLAIAMYSSEIFRASFSVTWLPPKPISSGLPFTRYRNTHWWPPSSRFLSHKPLPSQCMPAGIVRTAFANSLYFPLILYPLFYPSFYMVRNEAQWYKLVYNKYIKQWFE